MKVLDLCCGMGGLSLGFALAGFACHGLDIDPRAVLTYNLNLRRYGCRAEVRDILRWGAEGGWDIVVGGTPCQPFSRANTQRRGESHPLYPVTPRFFELVAELRPKAFLWENVKGLLDRPFRDYFERFLSAIKPLYRLACAVLNAADYGVPQRRERLIVVGVRRDLHVEPSLPKPTHAKEAGVTLDGRRLARWVTVREAIGDLAPSEKPLPLGPELATWFRKHPLAGGDGPSPAVLSHMGKDVRRPSVALMFTAPSTVVTTKGVGLEGGHEGMGTWFRRPTVREALRLQGFPDWWRFPDGLATTHQYRLVGEAVPPILAYRLAVHLGRLLGHGVREPPEPSEWCLPYFRRAFQDYFGG